MRLFFRLRKPVSRMTAEEQKLEGEFRYVNSRIITNWYVDRDSVVLIISNFDPLIRERKQKPKEISTNQLKASEIRNESFFVIQLNKIF